MHTEKAFTLIELVVVLVIVMILAAVSVPMISGNIIKAKMSEIHMTVGAISSAEDAFYMENGFYATLPYSITQDNIDNFMQVLGLEIPGMDSIFVYGVYYEPARIYIRVREHYSDWGIVCYKWIEGPNRGTWVVRDAHPWASYFSAP